MQASQIIDRPSADVFRFVATDHFHNHPKWDPSIAEMEQTSVGPLGAGTTARLVRLERGKRVEGTVEVTEYEPDRRFAALARFGPFVLDQHVTVQPIGKDSCRLTLAIDSKATGRIRLLLPLLRGTFRRSMTESLQRIKEMVE